ncbi:MAG: 6-phosphogluconolactonase [Pseudomonas sp.]
MSEADSQTRGLNWRSDPSPQAQAVAVAEHIVEALQWAIDRRGKASLALSGGRGPELFLRQLEQSDLAWDKVTITLVDERWVPADDAQSNAGLIRRCIPGVLQQARWLRLYRGESLEADAEAAQQMLEPLLPLDVVVLGMGDDGHTASLFPHMPGLAEYLSPQASPLCVAVPADGERLARLSMTARAIQSAGSKLLVITGENKRQVLHEALASKNALAMPIEAFLSAPMDIFYSPDKKQESE